MAEWAVEVPGESKRTAYYCGCVLIAVVSRDDLGHKLEPHSPLTCPVHGKIWVRADSQGLDRAEGR